MIVSLYLSSERLFRVVKACFDGIWLGLLSRERLHAIDTSYSERYADEGYNRGGLWPWEQAAIDRFFAGRTRIVVTGAGGGCEVLALRKLGYDAIGFDPNAQLAAVGDRLLASEGHPGRLWCAPRDVWPGTAGPCDGVVVGWGSYMLIQGRARRVTYLRGARACLPEGAPILVSFFARGGTPRYGRSGVNLPSRSATRSKLIMCITSRRKRSSTSSPRVASRSCSMTPENTELPSLARQGNGKR